MRTSQTEIEKLAIRWKMGRSRFQEGCTSIPVSQVLGERAKRASLIKLVNLDFGSTKLLVWSRSTGVLGRALVLAYTLIKSHISA